MSGAEFEQFVADLFHENGFWALRIPKNERGAQPFDILAIRGNEVYAVDCKVCGKRSFPMARIEDNQWLAMEAMWRRTTATIGLLIYHDGKIYFVPFEEVRGITKPSIRLDDAHLWELME